MTRTDRIPYSHDWKDPKAKSIWTRGPDGIEIMQFNDLDPDSVGKEMDLLRRAGYGEIWTEDSKSENELLDRGYLTPDQMSDPSDWDL